MPRILLTFPENARRSYYGDDALAALRLLGDVVLNATGAPYEIEGLVRAARNCQVIVSDRQSAAPQALFAHCPDLAVFMRCAVDIRNVDVASASRAGVLVTRASPGFDAAVAEWIIGAMIDLRRHITDAVLAYRQFEAPAVRMGQELRGATLGVIGYGVIGRYLCRLALAFGMRVLASDPHARIDDPAVRQLDLEEMLGQSDIVVCLAPATAETEGLMNAARFARMKRGAHFVNAARGELVDEAALLDALEHGQPAACALDVGRAPDQMPSPALAAHPRVIATPHIGGLTPPAAFHQSRETVTQLATLLHGQIPDGAVNIEHARRLPTLTGSRTEIGE